jgi:hypothetical protein
MCLAIIPPILRKIATFLSIHGSEKLGVFKQDFLFVGWNFPFCVASIKATGGLHQTPLTPTLGSLAFIKAVVLGLYPTQKDFQHKKPLEFFSQNPSPKMSNALSIPLSSSAFFCPCEILTKHLSKIQ